MKNLVRFADFLNESTAAGNRNQTYSLPFSYTSNDPKYGYNSKSFVTDLKALFIERPEIKREITDFIVQNIGVSKIDDLAVKPFYLIKDIITEIERIIAAGEYEPEVTMPGGALLFIRNKIFKSGKGADFYINKKGTKVEVVTEDNDGGEKVVVYQSDSFPFDRYEFTEDEKNELNSIIKAKGA